MKKMDFFFPFLSLNMHMRNNRRSQDYANETVGHNFRNRASFRSSTPRIFKIT